MGGVLTLHTRAYFRDIKDIVCVYLCVYTYHSYHQRMPFDIASHVIRS